MLNTESISYSAPKNLAKAIKAIAKENDVSRSIVNKVLADFAVAKMGPRAMKLAIQEAKSQKGLKH